MVHRGSCIVLLLACLGLLPSARGAEYEDAVGLFFGGKYSEAASLAEQELGRSYGSERWAILKIQSELAEGKYAAAKASLEDGLRRSPSSFTLRQVGETVLRYNGQLEEAAELAADSERLVLNAPQRFASSGGRIALGRFFLSRGADAKKVLEQFFDVAIAQQPDLLEGYFATAELALSKEDDSLALETLQKAPESKNADPHFHYLFARAYLNGDRSKAAEAIAKALEINPRHADSLLLQADLQIDAEEYHEARSTLDRVFAINPHHPQMWAYRAVLAHLKSDLESEQEARQAALNHWSGNPEVDHLIGRKLSQKYRFEEGAAAQRRALNFDSDFRPAKVQLCQDLLRLGREEEGWRLADEVLAEDGYNVVGYNLVNLRDQLLKFSMIRSDHFIVRMEALEAELYGARVLAHLEEAHETLCLKYSVDIPGPVTVEIFPRKNDFAVRTFGMPGADGFLGVCFGPVITAISPAAQGETPTNWESVLWHEFCHTVTLTKTRNKMPRWLSEGISVYEEGERHPGWRSPLSPEYRQMILSEELTPLSELSSAFLAPKSGMHLQFAYFESALAVEFFIKRFGREMLNSLLQDLGNGTPVNQALAERSGQSLQELDTAFAIFVRSKALSVARDATWDRPEFPSNASSETIEDWLASRPKNFWGLKQLASALLREEDWIRAEEVLLSLKQLYPEYVGLDDAYHGLAQVYQATSRPKEERAILSEVVERDASDALALSRLLEIDRRAENWTGLSENAERLLSINPLVAAPHRDLASAAEHLGNQQEALAAYRAVSRLDDTDPAAIHYKVARLLQRSGRSEEALREVLKSLEEAPRYSDAHQLLLSLVEQGQSPALFRHPVEAVKP